MSHILPGIPLGPKPTTTSLKIPEVLSLLEQKYWNFHVLFHHLSQFFHFVLNLILILSALFSAHQYKAFFGKSGTIFQDESYQIFLMTIWLKHFLSVWKNLRFLKSKFFNHKINTKCSICSCKSKYYFKVNRLCSRDTSLTSRKMKFVKKQSVRESNSKLTAFSVQMPH